MAAPRQDRATKIKNMLEHAFDNPIVKVNKPVEQANLKLEVVEPYNKVVARKFIENGERYKKHEVKVMGNNRPITFEEACRRYVHRFTMDHVPQWALRSLMVDGNEVYYAPHYASDKEWYENTEFMGEGTTATRKYCRSTNQTWPCGKFLDKPFPEWLRDQTKARVRVNRGKSPPTGLRKNTLKNM